MQFIVLETIATLILLKVPNAKGRTDPNRNIAGYLGLASLPVWTKPAASNKRRNKLMIFSLFRRHPRADTISTLYGMIVAQARLPVFYRDYAVADTVNGRFDLIVLHLALLLDRLASDPDSQSLGQGIFDRFCEDMDDNLREMGIGDLKVPKEMRRMGEAFYGRSKAYLKAIPAALEPADGSRALIEALSRNIYGGAPSAHGAAPRLAAYMLEAVRELKALDTGSLTAGALRFPDPAAIPVARV